MIYEFTTLYHIHSAIVLAPVFELDTGLAQVAIGLSHFISFLGLDFRRLCRERGRHVLDIFIV